MIQKYEQINRTKREIILNNFIGGISWGIGVTIGLAIFIGVLTLVAKNIDFVPIVGDFTAQIINYIIGKSPTRL